MTKSDFLLELEKNLMLLTKEERNKTINYYSEMISDMIDGGYTQEEAVAKLGDPKDVAEVIIGNAKEAKKEKEVVAEPTFTEVKKEKPVQKELKNTKKVKAWPFILVGVLLLVVIIGVNVLGSIYFSRLPREKKTQEFVSSSIENIKIDTEVDGLTVLISDSDKIIFEYYENKKHKYELELEGNTLEIDGECNYSFFIDFSIKDYNSTLYIPITYTGNFEYDGATGDIHLEKGFSFNNVEIEVSTGLASIKNIKCNNLEVIESTGSIEIFNVTSPKAFVEASTGSIRIDDSKFNELFIEQSTGLTKINNLSGLSGDMNKISIDGTTGDIKFNNINALNIFMSISTGDIEGTFNDSINNYSITAYASTGNCNLPNYYGKGPKKLEVHTSTGDIEIDFAD